MLPGSPYYEPPLSKLDKDSDDEDKAYDEENPRPASPRRVSKSNDDEKSSHPAQSKSQKKFPSPGQVSTIKFRINFFLLKILFPILLLVLLVYIYFHNSKAAASRAAAR